MSADRVVLHVEPDRSVLFEQPGQPVTLDISPHGLAARHWPRGRPDALGLEHAIDDVENAIEQAGLHHADRTTLSAAASLRATLPQRLRGPGVFSRDAVEAEFTRLVLAVESGAEPSAPGPQVAALLLLRELMHHLGFHSFSSEGPD